MYGINGNGGVAGESVWRKRHQRISKSSIKRQLA